MEVRAWLLRAVARIAQIRELGGRCVVRCSARGARARLTKHGGAVKAGDVGAIDRLTPLLIECTLLAHRKDGGTRDVFYPKRGALQPEPTTQRSITTPRHTLRLIGGRLSVEEHSERVELLRGVALLITHRAHHDRCVGVPTLKRVRPERVHIKSVVTDVLVALLKHRRLKGVLITGVQVDQAQVPAALHESLWITKVFLKGTGEPKINSRVTTPTLADRLNLSEETVKEVFAPKRSTGCGVIAQINTPSGEAQVGGEGRGEEVCWVGTLSRERVAHTKGHLAFTALVTRHTTKGVGVE
jgi:hypothetical protein